MSKGRTFVEELVGTSIQTKAMDKLTVGDFRAERARIAERRDRIKRAARYETRAERTRITEKRWVDYLDACFDSDEMSAIEALARENHASF